MNDRTKTGLEILQAAVLLGIAADVLLRSMPWGLNVFLWVGLLITALATITLRRKSEFWTGQTIVLHVAMLFFALMYVWRDSEELKIFNFLAILTILAVLTLPALKIKIQETGIFHYGIAWIYSGFSVMLAPFWLLVEDIEWKQIPKTGWSQHIISVVRGLAVAVPLLFIFGALFMAADAVFEGIVQNTFNVNPDTLFLHSFIIGIVTWIVAGYFRGALIGGIDAAKVYNNNVSVQPAVRKPVKSVTAHTSQDALKNQTPSSPAVTNTQNKEETKKWNWREFDNSVLPKFFTLGLIETSIILGLINLLFLAFVIVQVPYLFGGMDLVQSTPDFKLAEYARRGFGELVAVSALVLPILLLSHWLLRKDKPINEKVYKVLAGIQIALLFVIMISAMQRLLLYTGNLGYGWTTDRFYPLAFMFFLALVFAWFALTVLRGARNQFAWGTLWLALFVLGTLHVMSPDDFIVRKNIKLMEEGRDFDTYYNSKLSADSVPVLLEHYDSMDSAKQDTINCNLFDLKSIYLEEGDFRSWNYSRWRANWLIYEMNIKSSDCSKRRL